MYAILLITNNIERKKKMKKCKGCGQVKPLDEFYINRDRGVIRTKNYCKECMKAKQKEINKQKQAGTWIPKREKSNREDSVDIVTKFLDVCDYDKAQFDSISKSKFKRLFDIDESFDFNQLKKDALVRLEELGYLNPEALQFTQDGDYLIFGDTFGKKTSTAKFRLLQNVTSTLNEPTVIVIGHNTDDYNDVSYELNNFNAPVYFLTIANELKDINTFCKQAEDCYIVRKEITICDILIKNQEHITPYVKTAISSLDSLIYSGKCIVNCTRHEYSQRTCSFGESFICSPGAMAKPHVIRVAYKLTLANGGRINVTPVGRDSFLKYRKNEIDKTLWECGCIIVHVTDGVTSIELVRIMADDVPSCVLQNGTYIDSKGNVEQLNPTYAVLSDLHAPTHDEYALCEVYEALNQNAPDTIYINGDLMDFRSMNPHNKYEAAQADFLEELETTANLLAELSELSEVKVLWGNHEAFMTRFMEQFPQFKRFFNNIIENMLNENAELVTVMDKNDVIPLNGGVVMTHGSNNLYGVNGKQIDKIAKSIGRSTIMGHTHTPAIRFGVYCAGCLCEMDQKYNNSVTSNWVQGYILVYIKNNKSYIHQVFLTGGAYDR
jgi:predicted phosphodiesterase